MKRYTKLATLPFALLLAFGLAACKQDAPEAANTAATADAPAATPSQPSAEETERAAQAAQEVAKLASDAGPPPVEGTDYVVIPNGQPFEAVAGKVEVVEVFNHVCPGCASFQPLLGAWKSSLPADVNFVYVPALFGGPFDTYARAFYAAQSLGLEEKAHDALYRAIHIDRTLRGERGQDTPQDIGRFYSAYGADPTQFAEAMGSFAVEGKLAKAKQFAQRTGVEGTPTLIVAGKYRITGAENSTRLDQIRTANKLIAMERANAGGTPAAAAPAADAPQAAEAAAEGGN